MNMGIGLVLAAAIMFGLSGVPGMFLADRSRTRFTGGELLCTAILALGATLGLVGAAMGLTSPSIPAYTAPWELPYGRFDIGIDAVSAVFLFPLFVVFALVPIYGLGYWTHSRHPASAAKLRLFFGIFGGAMSLLLIARDGVLFLIAWEMMALGAYFLITTEDEQPAIRRAGFVYLVATHIGTLCLLALFAVWRSAAGSFSISHEAAHLIGPAGATTIFILALLGFGMKAGIMPLHLWLPGAHAGAPSHISAVLSGVMLKMGIYGLVRITGLLPSSPPWFGGVLLGLGAASGVLGIAFAIGQSDIKRLLAYSSIENIGIIAIGLGLALLGRAAARADLIALGLGGALLHVWNHSLFKPLLFMGAGSVIHSAHARDIDELGSLAKRMPRTAGLFLIGAAAICALPPLNGFVSELLIYLGLFRTLSSDAGPAWPGAAAGAPALAVIGALAGACFLKLFGSVFLGQARTERALHVREAPATMTGPMTALAALCIVIGIAPAFAAPVLDRAVAAWSQWGPASPPLRPLQSLAALGTIGAVQTGLLIVIGVGFVALRARVRLAGLPAVPDTRVGTWDCGYARPSARMQYTGTSFAQMLINLFGWALRPKREGGRDPRPSIDTLFPPPATFRTEVSDTLLDRAVLPAFGAMERFLTRFRLLHQGQIQVYLLYMLIMIVLLFILAAPL